MRAWLIAVVPLWVRYLLAGLLALSVAFAVTSTGIPWEWYIVIGTYVAGIVWTLRYPVSLHKRIASLQRGPAAA